MLNYNTFVKLFEKKMFLGGTCDCEYSENVLCPEFLSLSTYELSLEFADTKITLNSLG